MLRYTVRQYRLPDKPILKAQIVGDVSYIDFPPDLGCCSQ